MTSSVSRRVGCVNAAKCRGFMSLTKSALLLNTSILSLGVSAEDAVCTGIY